MEKYYEIGKVQLRHNVWQQILISGALLLLSPLVLGIRNLDAIQSAKVLETFVALIGIILLPPVFYPEQDRDLRDVIRAKYTRISSIYLIRILLSLAAGMIFLLIYMNVMKAGNCEIEMGKFWFGTFAEIVLFGGMGIFAYGISDNLIIGYMVPLMYYVAAVGAGAKYLKWFYPFGMLTDYSTKYWIFAAGVLLGAAGVWMRGKRNG